TQGGSGGTTSVTPTADEDMPTITPPTRTGYTFGGYYTETNGGGDQYYNADGTSAHVCDLTGTVTLYAKWTANTYTVTLNRQGGSGQESVTATFGSAMPALNPVPSRTDCEFFGYYTETNGGGVKYYNADGTSARTWGIDANTTLYAYWKKSLANADITVEIPAQTYSGSQLTPVVTVKDNGIEVSDAHYNIILPEGRTNAGDYTINIEAKAGNTFYVDGTSATFTINRRTVTLTSATDSKPYDGNALTNDGVTVGGDGFADGEGATYDVTGTITDAGSTENTFTYTLNDGTNAANYVITKVEGTLTITRAASSVTAAPTAQSLVYDGSEQTLINAGTASGGTMYYSLDNITWSTELPTAIEAGAYTVYYKVEGDGNHDNTDAASIKAYIDYTITYDLDGGSVASANPSHYNVTTATFTLTNPTREGYDFAGWTGTGLIYPEKEVTIAQGSAGNMSYTATWETINFEENDITYEWTGSGTNLKVAGYNGTSITSLTIRGSFERNSETYIVTEIGEGAFMNSNLTELYLTNCTITVIGARAFKDCTNLSKIYDLSASLTTIEDEAFSGCNLTEFTIPETVTSIGARAFAYCSRLTSITIPEGEMALSDDVFENCNANLIIYVPEDMVESYSDKWPDYTVVPVGAIPYIAANGTKAYRTDYTVLTGSETSLGTAGKETWYVVNSISDISDINYDHTITLNGKVNIILADGCTMNVGEDEDGSRVNGTGIYGDNGSSLTIYGQSLGTGALNVYNDNNGDPALSTGGLTVYGGNITTNHQLNCNGGLAISGGTVNATGDDGIFAINVAISSGTVNATASGSNSAGIYSTTNVTITGGKVTATGNEAGIKADGNITLGWTDDTDQITASSFNVGSSGTINIANGKAFTDDDMNVYNSATPSATLAALTDVTLTPKKDFTLCTATVPDQFRHYDRMMYQFDAANNGYYKIGETVKDGETTLTLGTDYEFGSIEYADAERTPSYNDINNQIDYDEFGEALIVTINGKGEYAGTKKVTFTIISPSGSGTWGDLSWSVENGTLSITGTGAMNAAAKNDGYPWFPYASIITSVTIGDGITSVADYAFAGTDKVNYYGSVTTVSLPSTLTSIGDNAFAYCTGATITIPSSSNVTYGITPFNQVKCVVGTLSESADNTALIELMS
ncbi:MAG: leucine-rich repeat protein, partial [Prevotella sp.]|nr:leucine-rich repeat protein [Prevotella sp.]